MAAASIFPPGENAQSSTLPSMCRVRDISPVCVFHRASVSSPDGFANIVRSVQNFWFSVVVLPPKE